MDYTAAVEIGCAGFAGISGLFGWLWQRSEAMRDATLKKNAEDIESLSRALADHKLYVAEHYVTQGELTKAVENLDKTMQRLIDAVDRTSRETREGLSEIHRRIDGKADK